MKIIENIDKEVSEAVAFYWNARKTQGDKQKKGGKADAGLRSAVTGGAQLDGFISLFNRIIREAGINEKNIFHKKSLELPGFFRPTKEWDLLVIKDKKLIAAIEAKSQAGPSFSKNFNNRTEEAMGSALDLWTAFREGAFNGGTSPFPGYFFMLEDCEASSRPVKIKEPYFKVFPGFVGASYMKRYELFCKKLVLERCYTSACFITSQNSSGLKGLYREPANDLGAANFAKILAASVGIFT
ncbi:MAG: restriction endonuclease [Gammaproteobacteria bacterium]|nr:restriction endonuclease [Gammaproteobacteria bacterium]